ncbi:hypothetical protein [Agarivorans sp. DSG3-1]|uniref:hypothetical protein n=1 Tax=Agarivorans sp. DSG3-1 TaxID=3342249 RepID=UPI00398F1414
MMIDQVDWNGSEVLEEVFAHCVKPLSKADASKTLTAFLQQLDENSNTEEGSETSNRVFHMLLNEFEVLAKNDIDWLVCLFSTHLKYGDREAAVAKLIELVCNSSLSFEAKWFVYWQLQSHFFTLRHLYSAEYRFKLLSKAYKSLFNDFYLGLIDDLKKLKGINATFFEFPKRDLATSLKNRVVIISNQILSAQHAPTRLCMDMAKTYIDMGFAVSVLNLASLPSRVNTLFIGCKSYNNIGQFALPKQKILLDRENVSLSGASNDASCIHYLDTDIPFFQLENLDQLAYVLLGLEQQKPALVISISDNNLMADAIGKSHQGDYPVVTFPTVAELPIQVATTPVLRRKPSDELKALAGFKNYLLSQDHYPHKHESTGINRTELGLPENKFLISIVGSRLSIEVNDALLGCLSSLLSSSTHISAVFIGSADLIGKIVLPEFSDRIYVLGHQEDLFSTIAATDLFLNPDRVGGGTGGVMALGAGLPVATLSNNYSDVAWSVGHEFSFSSYEDISDFVLRCAEEPEFYEEQQQTALNKYEMKLDARSVYQKLLDDCGVEKPFDK